MAIRRSFLKLTEESQEFYDFKDAINLSSIFERIDCTLEDLINVYKLFHKKNLQVTRDQLIKKIIRCDKVVRGMGLDKNRSFYYNYSRSLLLPKHLDKRVISYTSSLLETAEYTIPDKVVAIKSLTIRKQNASDISCLLDFKYDVGHYKGRIESPLPPSSVWP